jgi:hypothetical protein
MKAGPTPLSLYGPDKNVEMWREIFLLILKFTGGKHARQPPAARSLLVSGLLERQGVGI